MVDGGGVRGRPGADELELLRLAGAPAAGCRRHRRVPRATRPDHGPVPAPARPPGGAGCGRRGPADLRGADRAVGGPEPDRPVPGRDRRRLLGGVHPAQQSDRCRLRQPRRAGDRPGRVHGRGAPGGPDQQRPVDDRAPAQGLRAGHLVLAPALLPGAARTAPAGGVGVRHPALARTRCRRPGRAHRAGSASRSAADRRARTGRSRQRHRDGSQQGPGPVGPETRVGSSRPSPQPGGPPVRCRALWPVSRSAHRPWPEETP